MKLKEFRDVLVSTGIPTYHYHAKDASGNYIVWAEERQGNAEYADDKMTMQGIEGTVTYFTKEEFDSNFDVIQEKLNSVYIAWKLEDVSYDKDTGYINFVWSYEIPNYLNS